ncbi:MAG: SprB repeat-containing protein [Bacteroidetes bacterium]|nr:SprB repeat-containing protein [Bacteroidota bacterium]
MSIAQPIILSNIASIKNARCFNSSDGSIVASVGGGTAPYIYSWNIPSIGNTNAAMNLPSGKYSLTIRDSNQCQHIDTMEVLSPPVIQQTATIVYI